jgi:hypothetical protein
LHSDIHWHYTLEPAGDERSGLIDRAEVIRDELNQPRSDAGAGHAAETAGG